VTLNVVVVLRSAERYAGILALVFDCLDEAIVHFEKSFGFDRRSGLRPRAIYSGSELASSLALRGTAEDREKAFDLISALENESADCK